jgi:hypothetical protein
MDRPTPAPRRSRTLLVALLLLTTFGIAAVAGLASSAVSAARPAPPTALEAAASRFADRLADAAPFGFTTHQTAVLRARPGGPSPMTAGASPVPVETLAVSDVLTLGGWRTGDYWTTTTESGPAATPAPGDVSAGPVRIDTLRAGGVSWSRSGGGWERVAFAPGFGIDPLSLARIPELLRHLDGSRLTPDRLGGRVVTRVEGTADAAYYPAAITAAAFMTTSPVLIVRAWIDETTGELVAIEIECDNLDAGELRMVVVDRTLFFADPSTPMPVQSGAGAPEVAP